MFRHIVRLGSSRLPWLAFLTIVLVLGLNFVAVRFSNRELPPFWGAAVRFVVASLILFGLARAMRLTFPRGAALLGAGLYGALTFGGTYAFLYWGMVHVPAGMASVLFASMPLVTILLALLLGLEQFRWSGLAGAALAVVGMGLAFLDQLRANVPLASLLAVLLGVVCAAVGGIVVKRFPKSHPVAANAIGMAAGAAILLVGSLVAGEAPGLPSLAPTWLALGWLVTSSIVGFVLIVWLLARWTASATSYATVLMPLVAVLAGSWLGGEVITILFTMGSGLVLLGVYLGALTNQPAPGSVPLAPSSAPDVRPSRA